MEKQVIVVRQVIFPALIIVMVLAIPAYAQWDDSPFGEKDCTGTCGRFTDTDGDGICDHSQPPPEERLFQTPRMRRRGCQQYRRV